MNTKYVKLIIAAALAAGAMFQASAQDKQTLDLLVSKGLITRTEADNLGKRSVAVTPKEKSTKSIKLTGRVQTQYENIGVTEYLGDTKTTYQRKNDFMMRRMFIGMIADIGSGWSATVIADLARSSDNYLEYAYISKKIDYDSLVGTADIGYRKVNFALEEYTSASKLITVERSIATRYFAEGNNGRRLGFAGRHTGLYWNGKLNEIEGLTYGVSVTNAFNNSPASLPTGADNSLMYAANVAYSGEVEGASFMAGVNFAYTDGMNVAGSAGAHNGAVLGVNPYIKVSALGFDLWSDFLFAQVEDGKNNYSQDACPMGVNVGLEYKIDIGEFGQIAPAVRYSWLDTDGRGTSMSDGIKNGAGSAKYNAGQSIYAGLNWYIKGNDLKFQLGYEWVQMNGANQFNSAGGHSDADVVRAQLQVLF